MRRIHAEEGVRRRESVPGVGGRSVVRRDGASDRTVRYRRNARAVSLGVAETDRRGVYLSGFGGGISGGVFPSEGKAAVLQHKRGRTTPRKRPYHEMRRSETSWTVKRAADG